MFTYNSKEIQNVMDQIESQLGSFLENPSRFLDTDSFKFYDRFFNSAYELVRDKVEEPKNLVSKAIDNSDVEIQDGLVDEEDLFTVADHYADLLSRFVDAQKQLDIEWLTSHVFTMKLSLKK